VMVVNVYILSEPPFCFRRRRVVSLYSRTFFRKKYAPTSRTIPFRTSRRISRNVSMIINIPFAPLKAQNVMKQVYLERLFGKSIAIGITINYKSRGGEWAAPVVE
jgi:hypothetical protein